MTNFYFVRHCETEMNRMTHIVGGQSNHTPPTELGIAQANQFGVFLRSSDINPDVIFSSGAVRTNATARIALGVAGINMPVTVDERLLELGQGEYEGGLREEVYSPENKERYRIREMDGKFPGGESILDVQQRKRSFLDEKHGEYPGGTIVVFGHGLAIRSLVGQIKNYTKPQILAMETGNVSLTRIDVVNDQPEVLYVGKKVISE